MMTKYDVIIIGAGPAGIAAAIFAARGTLSVLVIDDSAPAGGTVKNTHLVANYPGFPEPISGLDLTKRMFKQAKSFGAKFELAAEITDYNFKDELKWIEIDEMLAGEVVKATLKEMFQTMISKQSLTMLVTTVGIKTVAGVVSETVEEIVLVYCYASK